MKSIYVLLAIMLVLPLMMYGCDGEGALPYGERDDRGIMPPDDALPPVDDRPPLPPPDNDDPPPPPPTPDPPDNDLMPPAPPIL